MRKIMQATKSVMIAVLICLPALLAACSPKPEQDRAWSETPSPTAILTEAEIPGGVDSAPAGGSNGAAGAPGADGEQGADAGSDSDLSDDLSQADEILGQNTCEQMLANSPCYHPYLLIAEGVSRTYDTPEGETRQTITDVNPDGFMMLTTNSDGEQIESSWTCGQDGIAGYSLDAFFADVLAGFGGSYWDVEVNGTMLPADVSAGDSWQAVVTITVGIQQGGVDSKNIIVLTTDFTAVGDEKVSTPAGTFTALRIDHTTNGENTLIVEGDGANLTQHLATIEASGSDWYAPCIGKVRAETRSTVTGIADIQHESREELASISIGY
jgi:hypothetical protein